MEFDLRFKKTSQTLLSKGTRYSKTLMLCECKSIGLSLNLFFQNAGHHLRAMFHRLLRGGRLLRLQTH